MIKYNVTNSMIGNIYPIFLSNNKLVEDPSYYLYRIVSPGLSPDLIPYISLEKISERTKIGNPKEFCDSQKKKAIREHLDVISMCLGSREGLEEKAVEFLQGILWRDKPVIDDGFPGFPLIEMENGNNIQKSVIIGLRDTMRWKYYKLYPGNYVDILWTAKTYAVFKLCGEKGKEEVWIEPVGLYSNTDPNMKNPLPVNLESLDYPTDRWSITKGKLSELNRALKKLEWESFNRKEICVD